VALREPAAPVVLIAAIVMAAAPAHAEPPGLRLELTAGAGFDFGLGDEAYIPVVGAGLGARALVPTTHARRDIELVVDWRSLAALGLDGFDFTDIHEQSHDRLRFQAGIRFRGRSESRELHRYASLGAGVELHDMELTTVYDDGSEEPSYETQTGSGRSAVVTFGFGRHDPSARLSFGIEVELSLGYGFAATRTFAHDPEGPFGELQLEFAVGGEVW
jgi:hypothetical protein